MSQGALLGTLPPRAGQLAERWLLSHGVRVFLGRSVNESASNFVPGHFVLSDGTELRADRLLDCTNRPVRPSLAAKDALLNTSTPGARVLLQDDSSEGCRTGTVLAGSEGAILLDGPEAGTVTVTDPVSGRPRVTASVIASTTSISASGAVTN